MAVYTSPRFEFKVRLVITRLDTKTKQETEIDSDYLTSYTSQSSAENYLQWATGKILDDRE